MLFARCGCGCGCGGEAEEAPPRSLEAAGSHPRHHHHHLLLLGDEAEDGAGDADETDAGSLASLGAAVQQQQQAIMLGGGGAGPLELLAEANEAVLRGDGLLAVRLLAELCFQQQHSSAWVSEQVATCLARAHLLLSCEFHLVGSFPPVDGFFASLSKDEQVIVAVVKHLPERDGLDSFPVTYYRSNFSPHAAYNAVSRNFHAEVVMLVQSRAGAAPPASGNAAANTPTANAPAAGTPTYYLRDTKPVAISTARGKKFSKMYYWRHVTEAISCVVWFQKSTRGAMDPVVEKFMNRISRIFY